LGKRSAGWRFTFKGDRDNVATYENWKDMVVRFLAQGLKVYDEYQVEQDPAEFFRMVENWGRPDGDSNTEWCQANVTPLDETVWMDEDGNDFTDAEFS
jgi:hypothetical protein